MHCHETKINVTKQTLLVTIYSYNNYDLNDHIIRSSNFRDHLKDFKELIMDKSIQKLLSRPRKFKKKCYKIEVLVLPQSSSSKEKKFSCTKSCDQKK